MATLIANADGNLTASIWGLVDATSRNDSQAANTALTTSFVASTAFTPGAITIDGIAVKIAFRTGSPTGTMTVELAQGGVRVTGAFATCNVADLPVCSATGNGIEGGWQFFKFAAPVTLLAATLYTVRASTSSSSQVNLFSLATTNWSRLLRTTTTQTPNAGDDLLIMGEKTAAGAMTTRTVVMDSTASTDYGAGTTGASGLVSPGLGISQGGTLAFGTAAATNYVFRLSGAAIVYSGGVLTIGTVATPVPRGGTAWFEFDCAVDGDYALFIRNGGTYIHQGLSRTAGNNSWMCRLNTDEAVNSTSLGVDTDTGWLDNDLIAIASTTATAGQSERGALNGNAGVSTLTVDGFAGAGGGLAFAHLGTAPLLAEIILLTKSTGMRAVTAGVVFFINTQPNAIVDIDWVEYRYLGNSTGAFLSVTLDFNMDYTSFHDCEGGLIINPAGTTSFVARGIAMFNTPTSGALQAFTVGSNAAGSWLVSGVVVLRTASGSAGTSTLFAGTATSITEDVTVIGSTLSCISLNPGVGTIRRIMARCGASSGIQIANGHYDMATLQDFSVIRNAGISTPGIDSSMYSGCIDGIFAQGNGGSFAGSVNANYYFKANDFISNKDSLVSTAFAIGANNAYVEINGGAWGTTSAHGSTAVTQGNAGTAQMIVNNVDIADAVLAGNLTNWSLAASLQITRMDLVDGNDTTITMAGVITQEQSIFHTAAPSQRLAPSLASVRLVSGSVLAAVNDGDTKTISVWVQKSAAYNGTFEPRLVMRSQSAVGVNVDTVLDTLTVGSGTWEQLMGTTPAAIANGAFEFVVECNGTAGFVYVDDWAVS